MSQIDVMSKTLESLNSTRMKTESRERQAMDIISAEIPRTKGVNFAALTPEVLLIYCSTQLQGLDQQLKQQMNEQKKMLDIRESLNQAVLISGNRALGMTEKELQSVLDILENLYNGALVGHPTLQLRLNKVREHWNERGLVTKTGNKYHAKDIFGDDKEKHGAVIHEGIKQFADEIKNTAEIGMTDLQQLSSKRQTAVQLTTAILNKLQNTQEEQARKG